MVDIYAIYERIAAVRFWLSDEPPDEWGRHFRHNCRINGFGSPNISTRWPNL